MAKGFASTTRIAEDRSRSTIEGLLRRRGATNITAGRVEPPHVPKGQHPNAWIGFLLEGRAVLLRFPLPDPKDPEISLQRSGRQRPSQAIATTCERIVRQRWRALLLCLRARFATGDGRTVADLIVPRLGCFSNATEILELVGDA